MLPIPIDSIALRPPERRTEMMFFGHRAPDAQSELANARQLGLLATPQRTRRPAVAVTESLLTENTLMPTVMRLRRDARCCDD